MTAAVFMGEGILDAPCALTRIGGGLTNPAAPGFMLDATTPAVAFSVRKLTTAYTGSCMRVRRSGDNAESDIGFDVYGNLDLNALQNYVIAGGGAQNGYVVTWYDQSSTGLNATQATALAQPQIVASGVATIAGTTGRPSLLFADGQYLDTGATTVAQPFSVLWQTRPTTLGKWFDGITSTTRGMVQVFATSVQMFAGTVASTSAITTLNSDDVYTAIFNTTSSSLWQDGIIRINAQPVGSQNYTNIRIGGAFDLLTNFDGYIAELIWISGAIDSTTRISLNRNQGYYYNVTVA